MKTQIKIESGDDGLYYPTIKSIWNKKPKCIVKYSPNTIMLRKEKRLTGQLTYQTALEICEEYLYKSAENRKTRMKKLLRYTIVVALSYAAYSLRVYVILATYWLVGLLYYFQD